MIARRRAARSPQNRGHVAIETAAPGRSGRMHGVRRARPHDRTVARGADRVTAVGRAERRCQRSRMRIVAPGARQTAAAHATCLRERGRFLLVGRRAQVREDRIVELEVGRKRQRRIGGNLHRLPVPMRGRGAERGGEDLAQRVAPGAGIDRHRGRRAARQTNQRLRGALRRGGRRVRTARTVARLAPDAGLGPSRGGHRHTVREDGGGLENLPRRVASVAGEIGVAPRTRPEIDDVRRGPHPTRKLPQRLERLPGVEVERDGKDLRPPVVELDEEVLAAPSADEKRDAAPLRLAVGRRPGDRPIGPNLEGSWKRPSRQPGSLRGRPGTERRLVPTFLPRRVLREVAIPTRLGPDETSRRGGDGDRHRAAVF